MNIANCPVCDRIANSKRGNTPYWQCEYCHCLFQHPPPPKSYEGPDEKDAEGKSLGHLMSDDEKNANENLAKNLFVNWMKSKPGYTLDIGSKYPYLAHCLKKFHGCTSFGNDAISSAAAYANELKVGMFFADFEESDLSEFVTDYIGIESLRRYQLITMVHVFEHMHNPIFAMRRLRQLVADDGYVFIRMPDTAVAGHERDFSEHHYAIHPFFHCLSSITEILVQAGNLFTIAETYTMEPGQRDYILRPITKTPTLWAGIIAKNEERDLPRMLRSIKEIVDGAILIDTGSTDRTKYVFHTEMKGKTRKSFDYYDSSEKDENGDWKLWHFGNARNEYVRRIEEEGADYIFWVDADDEVIRPEFIRRALYLDQFDVFKLVVNNDSVMAWPHHRIWKTGKGIKYGGACHEYPNMPPGVFLPTLQIEVAYVKHDSKPGSGEGSNARNLRILLRDWETNKSSRNAFYIAQTHRDGGRVLEAIEFYEKRIEMGEDNHIEEWLFSHLYLAQCYSGISEKWEQAEKFCLKALAVAPYWSEFWNLLCALFMNRGNYRRAIGYGILAYSPEFIPRSDLWRERNKYLDQPARNLAICYLQCGELDEALRWAKDAKLHIQGEDTEWDKFIADITTKMKAKKNRIVLQRPGAIGDVLMTLNLIPELKRRNPDAEIHYQTSPAIEKTLGFLFRQLGIFVNVPLGEHDATFYNLIGYPLHEGYPDKKMSRHLLEYFYKEVFGEYPAVMPALDLPLPKQIYKGRQYITIQSQTGWSMYKNWFTDRWAELVSKLPSTYDVIQIGAASDIKIPGANHEYMGDMEACVNLVANADLHIGLDSFANHLTHYGWVDIDGQPHATNAVILFGSTQAEASGYPLNENIAKGLACQPCFKEDPSISAMSRGICDNPPGQTYEHPSHACMKQITVSDVLDRVRKLIPE